MKSIIQLIDIIGQTVYLLYSCLRYLPSLWHQRGRIAHHMFQMGYRTMPMVVLMSFFIGAVLSLQTGYAMRFFGDVKNSLGAVVGLSMARELGPVMVSFLFAGRMGSAITAELASMKIYQEIDALTTMRIPPEKILVLPRLISILFTMPILSIVGIVTGWLGGMVVAQYVDFIDVSSEVYWSFLKTNVLVEDITAGLIKAEIFGMAIVLICCCIGLSTKGGPREIGAAVTRAVVTSMVFILLADYFVTKILI